MAWWAWVLVVVIAWSVVGLIVCLLAGRSVDLADHMESDLIGRSTPPVEPARLSLGL